jgi:hypothetical protein
VVKGATPLRTPKSSLRSFLTLISIISPSLIFFASTNSLGKVTTNEPRLSLFLLGSLSSISIIIFNDTQVTFIFTLRQTVCFDQTV